MTTSATQRRARTPQTERVETTQRKIIDSALALLREGGFKSATLQAIARGADVSLGALQHHFESRDALMERLVIEVMEPLSDQGTVWPDRKSTRLNSSHSQISYAVFCLKKKKKKNSKRHS